MPDPVLIAKPVGAAAAAVAAALVLMLCALPWRAPGSRRVAVGCLLGIGVGFYIGCRLLGVWPHWPPREDQDRFLVLVFPVVLALELLAVSPKLPRWLLGLLRLAVTAGAAPVLLFGSSYLTNFADPDTREWSLPQALLVLGFLAAALGMEWSLVALLRGRAPGISLPAAVAITCGGAAVTIMLSGYATGGQLGLPLAAVLAGVMVAAFAVRGLHATMTWVGPMIVGLFSLLVTGHFFGKLTTAHAFLLFAAPLLAWLPEMPYVRRLPSWLRGLARVLLVAGLVGAVLFQAQLTFNEESSSGQKEPSLQDYMEIGR